MKELLTDLQMVLMIYGVFSMAYLANIVLSLYKNITIVKEKFSLNKLLNGLVQFVVLVIGTMFLVISIDLLVNLIGVNSNTLNELISVATIILTIGTAIVKYIKEAYLTLQDIIQKPD